MRKERRKEDRKERRKEVMSMWREKGRKAEGRERNGIRKGRGGEREEGRKEDRKEGREEDRKNEVELTIRVERVDIQINTYKHKLLPPEEDGIQKEND